MRYKDFHGGKKNPYSPTEELVIEVDRISILQGSSNYFTGSQEQSLSIEQVEMLWGLETGGFRLCYYRSVSVKANQQAVNSPALANCAEFMLEKQIITVICGADEFSNITPHGFLSLFILFMQELEFFNLFALLDPPEKEVTYSTGQKIQTVIASLYCRGLYI